MAKFKKCRNCGGKGFLLNLGDKNYSIGRIPGYKHSCPICFGKGSRTLQFGIFKK